MLLVPAVADGRWRDGSALRRHYRYAQTAAKLPKIRFHDLRHTFPTLVASDPETSERELQAWLGHADLRTMQRYSHYRPQKTAAQHIGRIFAAQQLDAATNDEGAVEHARQPASFVADFITEGSSATKGTLPRLQNARRTRALQYYARALRAGCARTRR